MNIPPILFLVGSAVCAYKGGIDPWLITSGVLAVYCVMPHDVQEVRLEVPEEPPKKEKREKPKDDDDDDYLNERPEDYRLS